MGINQIALKGSLEKVVVRQGKEKIISDSIGVVLLIDEKGPLNKKELAEYQPLENLLTSIDLLVINNIISQGQDASYYLTSEALEKYS